MGIPGTLTTSGNREMPAVGVTDAREAHLAAPLEVIDRVRVLEAVPVIPLSPIGVALAAIRMILRDVLQELVAEATIEEVAARATIPEVGGVRRTTEGLPIDEILAIVDGTKGIATLEGHQKATDLTEEIHRQTDIAKGRGTEMEIVALETETKIDLATEREKTTEKEKGTETENRKEEIETEIGTVIENETGPQIGIEKRQKQGIVVDLQVVARKMIAQRARVILLR